VKISGISVWQMTLPLLEPYRLSGGRLLVESLDSTFVRIDTDAGLSGWGEGCPWGNTYLPAHGPGIRAGLGILAPPLLGRDPRSLDSINRIMDVTLPGHPYVKSAVDIACWDILGQASGLPLWHLLGGEQAEEVAVNSSISTGTVDAMLALIAKARAKGYKVHSAKVGGSSVSTDIERIDAISASLPPDEKVTFDVNRAWTPGVALQVLNSVQARDWIEQPCETLDQCAHLASRVPQPIMLDECLQSVQDHLSAWKLACCEGIKVKPNRVGGLSRARQIRDLGVSIGWQMHIEDVGGSALADTAAIHLASSTPAASRLASWLSHDHLAIDPVAGKGVRNVDGFVVPPSAPGLGVVPDSNLIGEPVAVYGSAV